MLRYIAAAAVLTGCAAPWPSDYNVRISSDFTPEETQAALNALDMWYNAVPVQFHTEIVPNCDAELEDLVIGAISLFDDEKSHVCIYPSRLWSNEDESENGYTQWTENSSRVIRIDIANVQGNSVYAPIPYDAFLREIFAHEIGHAMGLIHVPNSLMNAISNTASPTLTTLDIDQWKGLR